MADIAAGYYKAKGILGSESFGSSDKGTEQVAIGLTLIDLNVNVFTILNFTDKSAPYSKERLVSLGWDGTTYADKDGEMHFNAIDSKEVMAHVFFEEYEGESRMKVEIQGAKFAFGKPMDAPNQRAFMTRLGGVFAQQGPSGPAPVAPAAGERPSTGYPANWDANKGTAPAAGGVPAPFKL